MRWSPCPPAMAAWPLGPLELQCCEEPRAQVGAGVSRGCLGDQPGAEAWLSTLVPNRASAADLVASAGRWAAVPAPWLTAAEGFRSAPVRGAVGAVPGEDPVRAQSSAARFLSPQLALRTRTEPARSA